MGRGGTGAYDGRITIRVACWVGRWRVIKREGPGPSGRRVVTVGSRTEADSLAADLIAAIDAGRLAALRSGPEPTTIADALNRHVDAVDARVKVGKNRPGNAEWTRAMVKPLLTTLGTVRLQDVTDATAELYARDRIALGKRPASVWGELRTLRSALILAVAQGWMDLPVTTTIPAMFRYLTPDQLGDAREIQWLRTGEVGPFLTAAHSTQPAPVVLAYLIALHAGLRGGEVLALQWSDWLKRDRELSIRREKAAIGYKVKAGKARIVPVTGELHAALTEEWVRQGQPGADGWITARLDGGRRTSTDSLTDTVHQTCASAGVTRVTFHGLRHTFATLALASGALSLVEVSRILGHASVDFTARLYVHVERRRLADGVDRLAAFYGCESANQGANVLTVARGTARDDA